LTHAQLTVAQLPESVFDAGKGLKLAQLEGDAGVSSLGRDSEEESQTRP
jgi:hypothetical protein